MRHHSRRLAAAALLLLVIVPGAGIAEGGAPVQAEAVAPLGRVLDRALAHRALRGARVVALVEGADGRELYARDADSPLIPASNAKVLTTLAAMARFGPTHRFETLLLADRRPDADGAVGTLVLRGGGDPAVNNEDWWQIARALHRAGLRRVQGDLVLDDSLFDRVRWHPSWGRTGARAYHAPVGALNANYGAFSVVLRPGRAVGEPVLVDVIPPVAHLKVVNRALTERARTRTRLNVDRRAAPDGEAVVVSGGTGVDADPLRLNRSVLDPTRYAGSVLRWQLEEQGIVIEGGVRVGSAPETTEVLLRHEGRTLAEIVRLCMKYSNNQIAEALVKQLGVRAGGRGTWEAGGAEMRRVLAGLGVDPDGFTLVDGSGLSYQNRATPRAFVQALRAGAASFDFGPEWVASMPLANLDGTLADRAAGAPGAVRAKTGTLTRVTALSGYARLASGERARFSILVNGYRSGDRDAMNAVDGFVTALANTQVDLPLAAHER
jgi:D-alanyl-D-alanine carboxypeptidase/D-alanyl-D-alanine-endopeptidase (penicillin-binding protein 4)